MYVHVNGMTGMERVNVYLVESVETMRQKRIAETIKYELFTGHQHIEK
jgi:hypothetical protein